MKEYSFRITEAQLHNLGSLMAAKATGEMLVCECGGGQTVFSNDCERISWSFNTVLSDVDATSMETTILRAIVGIVLYPQICTN